LKCVTVTGSFGHYTAGCKVIFGPSRAAFSLPYP
jgi:hypothetical protein